ncbi:MAG: lipid-A-disaccharide synthase [Desulfobulbaceae bacterium]|jgi:lipid-A-disaccharide synthase|nr:lipid-A-disaccharide synthase [Desulfobulbaceae bacterium]
MPNNEVMIVSGEASGDMHGARVLTALQKQITNLKAYGMGGTALKAAGMEILVDAADMAVVGIVEVLTHLPGIIRAQKILHARLKGSRPQLLILIDYPDFNLMLAAKAKKLGIPVLYFISPQVWAWRSGRVHKIKRLVDRMAVILPFEKPFYAQFGFDVDYVGHPLADHMGLTLTKQEFLEKHKIPGTKRYIGLLPGSRRKEVSSMLPLFLQAAQKIKEQHPDTVFLLPLAPSLQYEDLYKNGLETCNLDVQVVAGDRYELMQSCDLVLAASGTVTLELALLQVPMVVSYRIAPLTYQLGLHFIKVKYVSLVNLIADQKIVPEILQQEATADNISAALLELWPESAPYTIQKQALGQIKDILSKGGCSTNVAAIAAPFFQINH